MTNEDEVEAAIRKGFSFDDELVVVKYVPLGRELRVSCIEEEDGSIRVLPTIEYFVDKEQKIRLPGDKLNTNNQGNATGWATH